MPLPPLLLFTLLVGLAASLASRDDLKVSPRPALLTAPFSAMLLYVCLVLVPASAYFYIFHGDWFLLYAVDVRRIPSALAMVGFMAQTALAALAFLIGALLVRSQREAIVGGLVTGLVMGGIALVYAYVDRLALVGTHAQFHGRFGLEPFGHGALVQGTIAMGVVVMLGLVGLLARLWVGSRQR